MFCDINNLKNLPAPATYPKRYETLLKDIKNPLVKQNIADHLQPATSHDNIFTEKDLTWIYGFAFRCCTTVRHNNNGTMFMSGNLGGVYHNFKDKIDQLIPGAENSPIVGGNFFITPSQYGLHNDSMREMDWQKSLEESSLDDPNRKYVPWRNLIIPIFTAPKDIESHAVFFDQRHIDWAHVYNHGMQPGQETATTYPIVDDHSKIDFHTINGLQSKEKNLIAYDKDHYDKYLYYTPYRRLTGLTAEYTCEWKPGCPIVFDAVQLHATNQGYPDNQWTTKMGLLLCFFREVK